MKQFKSVLFLFLFSSLLWSSPLAQIYKLNDPIYQDIDFISIESGLNSVSSTGPLSGFEIAAHLEKIDISKLSQKGLQIYLNITQKIYPAEKDRLWNISGFITQEGYYNTNNLFPYYIQPEGYNQRSPLAYAEVDSFFGRNGYATFSYAFQKAFYQNDFHNFSNNNPLLSDKKYAAVQDSLPHSAFFSITGDSLTFIGGRDKVGYGRGQTGNLMLDSHVPYHDFALLTLFNKKIKYSFIAIPMNELITQELIDKYEISDTKLGESWIPDAYKNGGWFTFFQGMRKRTYIAHRVEIDIFPRWRIAFNEGTLFYSDNIDLRMLNPLMFLHNLQSFGEVNNSMGIETEFIISKNWALNFQFFLDQFQTKAEQGAYDDIPPNAYALLLSGRFYYPKNNWLFKGYIESVYTSPFAYLRAGDNTSNYSDVVGHDKTQYNLDFIHAVTMADGRSGVNWLGYKLGPDTIVVGTELEAIYKKVLKLSGSLKLIIQGDNGLNIEGKNQTVELFDNPKDIDPLTPYSANPNYFLILGLGSSIEFPNWNTSVYIKNHLIKWWNKNIDELNYQLSLGVKYSF